MSKPLFTEADFAWYVEHDIQAENCADVANAKTKKLQAKLAKCIEQRDRHLESYLAPFAQKEFFDNELKECEE